MLIWLASYPRSGNHLLRAILSRCFDLGSYEIYQGAASGTHDRLASLIGARTFAQDSVDAFLARARLSPDVFLVKTHDPVPDVDRCIYVVRDGRAALASYQRYLATVERCQRDLAHLVEGGHWPGAWAEHVERFLARDQDSTLVLQYEDLASENPPLDRISAFLGTPARRRFDISFSDLHAINPSIFPTGSNAKGIDLVEQECSALFWQKCGRAMRRLGYSKEPRGGDGPPSIFFFHLPKCAGTSIWGLLRNTLGTDRVFQAYSRERVRQFEAMDSLARASYMAIGGHFSLETYRANLDLSHYFSITTFRDPVQRIASAYHYAARTPAHSHHALVASLSFREFIERNRNPVTTLLCGKADAALAADIVHEVFDDWAFVDDDLHRLADAVCRRLGVPPGALPTLNVGPRTRERMSVDAEHREAIRRYHGADIELYRLLRAERSERGAPRSLPAVGRARPPAFHVVTPTYNTAAHLDEAISSIVSQEGDFRIHYHVQDGGSTDSTVGIARRWQERIADGAFKPRCLEVTMTVDSRPDGGMYDAIASGFRALARYPAEYGTWLNGDDRLAPGAMCAAAEAFRDLSTVELIGGRTAIIDSRGDVLVEGELNLYPQRSVAAGLHDGRRLPFIMQEGTFWRTGLWHRTGGVDPSFRLAGDWDLWRRFAAETEYVTLDTVTAFHRRRPGQLSEDLAGYYREVDACIAESAADRDRVLSEYYDAQRPGSGLLNSAFRARKAQRTLTGCWVLADWQLREPHELLPIDGNWIVAAGFGTAEGPFPEKGIDHRFHWATGEPAILWLYSTHGGMRTLSLRIGGVSRGQRIGVRIDGGRVMHRRLGKAMRLEQLTFRVCAASGLMTIEFTTDRWMTTPEGRRLGLMLGGMDITDEAPRMRWLTRFLPRREAVSRQTDRVGT